MVYSGKFQGVCACPVRMEDDFAILEVLVGYWKPLAFADWPWAWGSFGCGFWIGSEKKKRRRFPPLHQTTPLLPRRVLVCVQVVVSELADINFFRFTVLPLPAKLDVPLLQENILPSCRVKGGVGFFPQACGPCPR